MTDTEFFASDLGSAEPRVLARFATNERGLHVARFDRREGRWVQDNSVAGFFFARDDFAEQVTRQRAQEILDSWGNDPGLVDATAVESTST